MKLKKEKENEAVNGQEEEDLVSFEDLTAHEKVHWAQLLRCKTGVGTKQEKSWFRRFHHEEPNKKRQVKVPPVQTADKDEVVEASCIITVPDSSEDDGYDDEDPVPDVNIDENDTAEAEILYQSEAGNEAGGNAWTDHINKLFRDELIERAERAASGVGPATAGEWIMKRRRREKYAFSSPAEDSLPQGTSFENMAAVADACVVAVGDEEGEHNAGKRMRLEQQQEEEEEEEEEATQQMPLGECDEPL